MMITRTVGKFLLFAVLCVFGGFTLWRAAPDIETLLFPPFVDEYLVPFAPERPSVLVERQLDRVCWRFHIRKTRFVRALRRSITFILPDGTRYFASPPLDARTGRPYINRDAVPGGFDGTIPTCAWIPDDFDATQAFVIESFGQYDPPHHLWALDHTSPLIDVPASAGGAP